MPWWWRCNALLSVIWRHRIFRFPPIISLYLMMNLYNNISLLSLSFYEYSFLYLSISYNIQFFQQFSIYLLTIILYTIFIKINLFLFGNSFYIYLHTINSKYLLCIKPFCNTANVVFAFIFICLMFCLYHCPHEHLVSICLAAHLIISISVNRYQQLRVPTQGTTFGFSFLHNIIFHQQYLYRSGIFHQWKLTDLFASICVNRVDALRIAPMRAMKNLLWRSFPNFTLLVGNGTLPGNDDLHRCPKHYYY